MTFGTSDGICTKASSPDVRAIDTVTVCMSDQRRHVINANEVNIRLIHECINEFKYSEVYFKWRQSFLQSLGYKGPSKFNDTGGKQSCKVGFWWSLEC